MKKKKILVISNNSWSLYKFRIDYLRKLKNSFELTLFTPDKDYKKKFKNFKFFYPKKNEFTIIKIYKLILNERFDMVLVYSFKMQFILSVISIFKKINLVFLIAGRGSLLIQKRLCYPIFKYFINLILLFPKKIIFINPYDKSFFLKNFYIRNKIKFFLIPTEGITVNKKFKFKNNKKKNFILFARIILEKGILEYSKAVLDLNDKYAKKLKFTYAGPKNEKAVGSSVFFQSKLQTNLFQKNKRLKYLGNFKSYKEIFNKMDCLIAPSHGEGAGKSVMEGMISGLYIIASNVSGHKYLLKNTGNLLIKNNSKDIIFAIIKFLKLPKKIIFQTQKKSYLRIKKILVLKL